MKLNENRKGEYGKYLNTNTTDAYSSEIVAYAERWADLMEARMYAGAHLEDIAETTSHEADTGGITGFMYGAAISASIAILDLRDAVGRMAQWAVFREREGEEVGDRRKNGQSSYYHG